ncbi:hypothetical protein [Geobacter argillaceus]|uniref:Uncharacterized protein n=1 Tax=Geobacter argillaceus TaxID=345631 RepID=A0A562V8Y1_9BACT|nr:hypothetical protein [Geobacter argillaceus]TWJ14292.1 hypothetical protein JN12_03465 [Geobacter argillaceus]
MNKIAQLAAVRFVVTPALLMALVGCAFFSDGVVTAVESHYITSKQAVLSISGETASHPLYGVFQVDNPPRVGKPYRNDGQDATLTFLENGPRQQAVIEPDDRSSRAQFDMHLFGGPKKATVLGIFW